MEELVEITMNFQAQIAIPSVGGVSVVIAIIGIRQFGA
jgi:hypothetical protein